MTGIRRRPASRPRCCGCARAPGSACGGTPSRSGPTPEGWDLVTTTFGDVGWFADHVASFGADVVVLEPARPARRRDPPAEGGAGVSASGRRSHRDGCSGCWPWCRTWSAGRRWAGRDGGGVRGQRARAGRRPEPAVVRRAARAGPLLPDRPVLRGRRDRGQPGRVDGPAAAAGGRRGQRAAGRAADAGRGAGRWRTGRRCPGSSPSWRRRRGRRPRSSAQVAVQVDGRTGTRRRLAPRSATRLPPGAGCTCATTCRAGTRPPSVTWTRCGCSWWTAGRTWRAGAAAPRGSGCSGWTGCWRSRCSTWPRAAAEAAAGGRGPGPVPAVARRRARGARAVRRTAAGWPSTTRASQ